MPVPTVADTLKDPQFYNLPPDEQQKVLYKLDPSFIGLPASERAKVLQMGKQSLQAPQTLPASIGNIRPLTETERFEMTYPVGAKGEGTMENIHNVLQNVGVGMYDIIRHPVRAAQGAVASVVPEPLMKAALHENYETDPYAHTPNPIEAIYNMLNVRPGEQIPRAVGQGIATMGVAKAVGALGSRAAGALTEDIAPVEVPIAGEKVPVLRSEAFPGTKGANLTESLKKSGVGAPRFKAFAEGQQAAVKRVIQNVARQTAGVEGWAPAEPSASMDAAANTVFAKAKPMYQALDASLKTVPDALNNVSKIMQDAIAKAKKLGVNVSQIKAGGEYTQGEAPGSVVGRQPLTTYLQVRSELLKAQRAALKSNNGAMADAISREVNHMNGQIEATLSDTPLYQNWLDANKLWGKGHALSEVADELSEAVKGTPEAQQHPMLGKVPTKVQGPSLVDRLNGLEREGVLDRAFTPKEKANFRQAADILDRAKLNAGTDTAMAPGHTFSTHSLVWRTLLRMPAYPLIRAMTTTEGLAALRAASTATTVMGVRQALAPIIAGANAKRSQQ